jgi:hypothetical protein
VAELLGSHGCRGRVGRRRLLEPAQDRVVLGGGYRTVVEDQCARRVTVRAGQRDDREHVGWVGCALEPAEMLNGDGFGWRAVLAGEALDFAAFARSELTAKAFVLERS